jgi:hypothetical protein
MGDCLRFQFFATRALPRNVNGHSQFEPPASAAIRPCFHFLFNRRFDRHKSLPRNINLYSVPERNNPMG